MIFLNPDGTSCYSLTDILPAGCVEIGLDGCQVPAAAVTPPPPPEPPKVDLALAAAMQRLAARTGLPK